MSAPRCVYIGCTGQPASPEFDDKFCDQWCAANYGMQAADALVRCRCGEWVHPDDECGCGEDDSTDGNAD